MLPEEGYIFVYLIGIYIKVACDIKMRRRPVSQ